MTYHIITLFPEAFAYLNTSILNRAQKSKKIKLEFYNPRDFVPTPTKLRVESKPYLRIDDKPYGGGAGMVMQAMPIVKAVEKALKRCGKHYEMNAVNNHSSYPLPRISILWLSPSGKQFDNSKAEIISKKFTDVIIICGRYEGIDERAYKIIKRLTPLALSGRSNRTAKIKLEKLSVGPYVLTGGEIPAMVIIDAVSRRIPGVLGKDESVEERRIASNEVYTRPEVLNYGNKKYRVPKVLLSGNHKKITEWRLARKLK